jgi:tRNA dimethylallyltransferase
VYKSLDVGTGKDLYEYNRNGKEIPYHLIDVVDLEETYSLYRYQQDVYSVMSGYQKNGYDKPFILVGGTGLYIEAVLKQYQIPIVPEDFEFRRKYMEMDMETLRKLAESMPDVIRRTTDFSSKKRLVRALEVAHHTTGSEVKYSALPEFTMEHVIYGLCPSVEQQNSLIRKRLLSRLNGGMEKEVAVLLEKWGADRLSRLGMEYRELTLYLTGQKSYNQMIADLEQAIIHMAKQQRTYFRGFTRRGLPLSWLGDAPLTEMLGELNSTRWLTDG